MSWNNARERFADYARGNFIDQDPTAMGVEDEIAHLNEEDFRSLTKDEYQSALRALGTHEHIDLDYEEDSPWGNVPVAAYVREEFFDQHLSDLKDFYPNERCKGNGYDDVVAEISFDLSNEFEKATGVNLSLTAAHNERELIDELQNGSIPEGSGLYRVGHVPGFMNLIADDFFDRKQFESGDYPSKEESLDYMTQKRRYIDHLKSHGLNVMSIGGTDSIQLTMRPLMEEGSDESNPALAETYGEGYTRADMAADDMFRDFFGGGSRTSISALSPILYAPFMSSPVFDDDGELREHMGREWAYEEGLSDSNYVDTDGTRKWGYIPEMADVEGVEDTLDVFADKIFQFSAGVEAGSSYITVVDDSEEQTLYDAYHEDHPQIEEDTSVNVRVGHDDYGQINFKDFVEERRFEGIVSLPGTEEDEDGDEVVVEVDYTDLDDDAFYDTVWDHFEAHSSGVWPNYRPRFKAGAFESRDYGNSPRIREAIDTQAAVFLKWEEIQEYADEELDMWEGYADVVRDGVAEEGLDYVLPSGDTVEAAWRGNGREQGLLDILTEGVAEASYHNGDVTEAQRQQYADGYRQTMENYLDDGTYSEVFARNLAEGGLEHAMEETRTDSRVHETTPVQHT